MALSTTPNFDTFHSNTTAIPTEITTQVLGYVIANAQPLPLGGGVSAHIAHHPIASVSRIFRSIYLDHPYSTFTKGRESTSIDCRIGEALEFRDLRTLTAFFENGHGQDIITLSNIRLLSISYLDDCAATGWGRWTINYAYEAFEHLYKHWDLMRISWLRLCLPCSPAISSVDDPGVWSLLKIRNLPHLTILGLHGCIASEVRKYLKRRTRKKKLFPWNPLGLENVEGRDWRYRQDRISSQEHYKLLDSRYKYLHHRETVTERCQKRRNADHKRRRRWPMLSKRRRKRSQVVTPP